MVILKKYEEYGMGDKITLTINDFEWGKFVHIDFWKILVDLENEGLIKEKKMSHFPTYTLTLEDYKKPKFAKCALDAKAPENFFFEIHFALTDKFYQEFVGREPTIKSIKETEVIEKTFPHKLNRGTRWENIIIEFIDEDKVNESKSKNKKEIVIINNLFNNKIFLSFTNSVKSTYSSIHKHHNLKYKCV